MLIAFKKFILSKLSLPTKLQLAGILIIISVLITKILMIRRMASSVVKPVVINATGNHTATIIFLHGLGDTGHGWAEELAQIKPSYVKLICPTAETMPVTLNMGFSMPSWFDIRSLDKDDKNEDIEGIKKASNDIIGMIDKEISENPKVPASRIMLGGFSQGAALSLFTGLTGTHNLAGIISLSGYLPGREAIEWEKIKKPPVLQCHGDADSVVNYQFALGTAKELKPRLTKYTFKTYKGLDHSSSMEEMSDVDDFIKECIPEQASQSQS